MKTVRITEAEFDVLEAARIYAKTQSGEACRDLLQMAMRLNDQESKPAAKGDKSDPAIALEAANKAFRRAGDLARKCRGV